MKTRTGIKEKMAACKTVGDASALMYEIRNDKNICDSDKSAAIAHIEKKLGWI